MTKEKLFNALCKVVIYNFCDLCQNKGLNEAIQLLIEQGVMRNNDDIESAYTRYDEFVVEHALVELPEGYSRRHDYWGAPCITNVTGWNAPKGDHPEKEQRSFFAGDSTRIMFFADFAALQEYTEDVLKRIDNEN